MVVEKSANGLQLSNEELQQLLNKLSTDERNELTGKLRQCTQEMTMTRGIPITAAVLGSLYYARTRLPAQYHFGPKGWPFYAFLGVGTLTAVNVLSMGNCRDRVQPLVAQLYQKYHIGQSTNSYDAIRRRHREEYGYPASDMATTPVQARGYSDMQSPTDRPVGKYGVMQDRSERYGDMRAPDRSGGRYGDMRGPTDRSGGRYGDMQTDPYGTATDQMPSMTGKPSEGFDRTYDFTPAGTFSDSQPKKPTSQDYMYDMDAPSYMSGTPTTPRSSQGSEWR
ncbi:unnamed protein product [Cylicocyclus nassatus]|uniref:Uncharacterized protein n=1 Tax=Cylicocyclus nassatus TaxID=53992 RepID=A0AA36DV98_CYLNA|nr:unnamed protein product [Cylicocyclus nassatus]